LQEAKALLAEWLRQWVWGVKPTHKITLEVVDKTGPGFQVLPRRWTVERTFAWLLNYRRHSRDYEVRTENSEAMIQVSMIHLLLKRLAVSGYVWTRRCVKTGRSRDAIKYRCSHVSGLSMRSIPSGLDEIRAPRPHYCSGFCEPDRLSG
jgi:hypothetical protein